MKKKNNKTAKVVPVPPPVQGNGLTAEDIFEAILELPDSEKKRLPALIRTDYFGIKAHQCFVFGGYQIEVPPIIKPIPQL